MGLFSGITKAEVRESVSYIQPGVYPELEILECKAGRNRKNLDFFVVRFKVHKSTGPNACAVGSVFDWMVMLHWDSSLGDIKSFLASACGIGVEEVDEAGTEAAIGEEQPLTGMRVSAEATSKLTKKGTPFTPVRWYPHDPAAAAPPPPPAAPKPSGMFAKK